MDGARGEIELRNGADACLARDGLLAVSDVRSALLSAGVGSTMLQISAELAQRLGLRVRGRRPMTFPDGSVRDCDVVGPIEIRFGDRTCWVSAVAVPRGQTVLGSLQMAEMDLVVDAKGETVVPNPSHPDGPLLYAVSPVIVGSLP